MRNRYNYRQCQSLFGYAQHVHERSGIVCQLCGCDAGQPPNFDLWRQMTVEHVIGKSQGGYLAQLRILVAQRFPDLALSDQAQLAAQIDALNTVTACSFCNATTSQHQHTKTMHQLLAESAGAPSDVLRSVAAELALVLERKRADVQWKLEAIRTAFEAIIVPKLPV